MARISLVSFNLHHAQGARLKVGEPLVSFVLFSNKTMKRNATLIADYFMKLKPEPDILCLQEGNAVVPYWPDITRLIQERMKYPFYAATPNLFMPHNNVIISRLPFRTVISHQFKRTRLLKRFRARKYLKHASRGFIAADIAGAGLVVNTHLDPISARVRHTQIKELCSIVGSRRVILAGDFNTHRANDELFQILKERGFRTKPALSEENFKKLATWPMGRPRSKRIHPRLRLDYVFVSRDKKIISTEILNTGLSDHAAVRAVIG